MDTLINNPLGVWGVIVGIVSIVGFTWFTYQSFADGEPEGMYEEKRKLLLLKDLIEAFYDLQKTNVLFLRAARQTVFNVEVAYS